MNFKDSLNNTKLDLTNLILVPSGGSSHNEINFEIDAKTFLKYAKEDFHSGSEKGIINGLSNAKRAIDCKVDELIRYFGIDYQKIPDSVETFVSAFKFKDDIPFKLKFIQGLNLAPGFIVAKYRNLRNKLEHLYQMPSTSEVKEAIDIADLFIRSIEGKLKSETNEFYLTDINNVKEDFEIKKGYELVFNGGEFFDIWEYNSNKRGKKVDLCIDDPEFFGFVRLMYSIDDNFELNESMKIIIKLIEHPMPLEHIKIE